MEKDEVRVPMVRELAGRREECEILECMVEDYLGWGWVRAEDAKPAAAEKPAKAKQ